MQVMLCGTRGSLASPGPDTARYGGNTSCVSVIGREGTVLILDAGTGIRRLGALLPPHTRRVDILLTHLHMDHVLGLGFFAPLYQPGFEVHIWGPASATLSLQARLKRYLSPPLFPVSLGELPCQLSFHAVPCGIAEIGEFEVRAEMICHPGPTVGYRIRAASGRVMVYMPDHEPALGNPAFPNLPRDWTSGASLAIGADLLIHDSQYSAAQYPRHSGWGHSSLVQTLQYARLCEARHLVTFHHDPGHSDQELDRLTAESIAAVNPDFAVTGGCEGAVFVL
ncbi:MAG: MBL fold metallo-hydrolase [Xanthomonadales bacterium]|jgi:phosphoribosyl 1,2-cyclic phosphodiesterase|nr:MBL fold metallo-hydrolase [Xanthomonadales bacterium]